MIAVTRQCAGFGPLHGQQRTDGSIVAESLHVPRPLHRECDFWLVENLDEADNDPHFFGPTEAA